MTSAANDAARPNELAAAATTARVGHLTGECTDYDFGNGILVAAIRLPNRAVIALSASIGDGAQIGSGAKIGSRAHIGSDAHIGACGVTYGTYRCYVWTAYRRTDDRAPGLYLSIGYQLHTADEWDARADEIAREWHDASRDDWGDAIRALVAFVRVLLDAPNPVPRDSRRASA